MRKVFFIYLLAFSISLNLASFALAQDNPAERPEVYFFYSEICPHCTAEKKFLEDFEKKYPEFQIHKLKISDEENAVAVSDFYRKYEVPQKEHGLVPVTFIKDKYFLGFNDKIGHDIENYLLTLKEPNNKISLPFIGEIDFSKFSPAALAVILGTFDGFNVCSLTSLVLILGLVLALRSRIKIFIFGGTYIITTAIVYGILIFFWYKLFSFFASYFALMKILTGILGIGGGIYFFRQFLKFRKEGPMCEITPIKGIASQFSIKIQGMLKKPGSLLLIVGSIFMFAAVITLVEFPCSAVVPVIFAGILAQSHLPAFYYLLYIAIFLFFYMLDEIIIFLIALFTTHIWLASGKFVTCLSLAGAIIFTLFGVYYLFGL